MRNLEELERAFIATQSTLAGLGKEIEALKDPFRELKKARMDGAKIEQYCHGRWVCCNSPLWGKDSEYRIKPEPKPDVVSYVCYWSGKKKWDSFECEVFQHVPNEQIKLTRDGETGKLKAAEVI